MTKITFLVIIKVTWITLLQKMQLLAMTSLPGLTQSVLVIFLSPEVRRNILLMQPSEKRKEGETVEK